MKAIGETTPGLERARGMRALAGGADQGDDRLFARPMRQPRDIIDDFTEDLGSKSPPVRALPRL